MSTTCGSCLCSLQEFRGRGDPAAFYGIFGDERSRQPRGGRGFASGDDSAAVAKAARPSAAQRQRAAQSAAATRAAEEVAAQQAAEQNVLNDPSLSSMKWTTAALYLLSRYR
jgi:hypothetical protein